MTDYTKSLAFFSLVFLFIHCRPKAKNKTVDAAISALVVLVVSPDLTDSAFYQQTGTMGILAILAVSALVFIIVTLIIMLLEEGRDS